MAYILLILFVAMSALGGFSMYLKRQNDTLRVTAETVQQRNVQLTGSIVSLQSNVTVIAEQILIVGQKNNKIDDDNAKVKKIFEGHDLNEIARKKAGLLETRVNKGSQKALDKIEQITDPNYAP